jgi:hypothetical protein
MRGSTEGAAFRSTAHTPAFPWEELYESGGFRKLGRKNLSALRHYTGLLRLRGRKEQAGGQLQFADEVANLARLTARLLTPLFAVKYRHRRSQRPFSGAPLERRPPFVTKTGRLEYHGHAGSDVIDAEELHQLLLFPYKELFERLPESRPLFRRPQCASEQSLRQRACWRTPSEFAIALNCSDLGAGA